jgi:hypothetical protein
MERAALSRVWGILLSGPVLSAVWLLACGAYIHTQVGWDVLPTMLPNEIAVTVLGVTMPLAFIGWSRPSALYLNQFETLLAQARECDHMDVLGATFVTADVGKLYLILSNAVGRLKH